MLILLVGTGIFLTVRTRFLTWRNLGYALKSTLSKEARTKSRGQGDVSPFSALTTALAATIGTGNIVGVATAMVSGGPGALVWNFSDIANALMAIPNLICMLLLSGEIAKDVKEFQPLIRITVFCLCTIYLIRLNGYKYVTVHFILSNTNTNSYI